MRRALSASAFAVFLLAIGLGLFPRWKMDSALANVARAMARVKSMHVVGWKLRGSGERQRIEIWAKQGEKLRYEYGDETVVDDGRKLLSLIARNGSVSVTINRPKAFPGLGQGMSYLDLFMGEQLVKQLTDRGELGVAGTRAVELPDGRRAVLIPKGDPGRNSAAKRCGGSLTVKRFSAVGAWAIAAAAPLRQTTNAASPPLFVFVMA